MISINSIRELNQQATIDATALGAPTMRRLDHQDSKILLGSEHLERPSS
jgi:hypothetical protein